MLGFKWAQCRRVRPVLWDYVGERLSEGPMELVEEHLQACASCRREAESLKSAQNFLTACRAEEEPASRSNWNAARQRILAEGDAPVSAAGFPAPTMSHSDGSAWNPRAAWRMQMLTSMAGGFAAVLLVAGGYGLLHIRQSAPVSVAVSSSPSIPASPVVAQTASDMPEKRIIAATVNALNSVRVHDETREIPAREISANTADKAARAVASIQTATPVGTSHKREHVVERRTLASIQSAHRATTKAHAASAVQRLVENTTDKPQFRPYKPTAQDRLPEPTQIAEANSRYALEHVRPVGYDDGEYSTYVVGSVRPVSRDDEHDY